MGKLYNNFKISTTNLANSHIQKCEPNTPYSFKESGNYYIFYVKSGQIQLVNGKDEFTLKNHQLIVVYCKEIIHLFVSFVQSDVLVFHFGESTNNIEQILNHVHDVDENLLPLISSIEYRLNIIQTIKSSKPSILYDKEIGNFFNVTSSLLYSSFNNFLLVLIELKILDSLPDTIKFDFFNNVHNTSEPTNFLAESLARTQQKHIYKNALINQIIKYMNDNLDSKLTIDQIADEFLMGSANLKRIFKNETGQSIIHYFHLLKMDAAQALIIKNEKSHTEIASSLGFNSVHHFSTSFKKHTGYSPSRFYQLTMMKY